MKDTVGCFEALWAYIWNMICQSKIYWLLRKIYDGISGAWRRSRITSFFRRENFSSEVLGKSVTGRLFRLPFTLLDRLRLSIGQRFKAALDKSVIVRLCNIYLQNMLSLNLRFIGFLITGASAGIIIGGIINFGKTNGIWFIIAAAGVLLSLCDVNITAWLRHSVFVRFICSALGIQSSFEWYDSKATEGKSRLALAAAAGLVCGAAGVMGGSALLGAAMILGLPIFFLLISKPEFGLFCIVFAAPIAPTMAMAALSMLTLFALIVKSIITPDFKWHFDGLGFLIMVFIAVYLIAGITSFAPKKSLSIWVIYLVFASAYFIVINLINNKKQLGNLLTLFVVSGLLVCLYGIAQYVFGWDTAQAWMDEEMFTDIKMRIYSTLGNPNVLGEYILLVLPASIGLMWTRKGALQKIVYAGISVAMFAALILTFSRGCWLGLIAAAAIFITFAAGKLWGLALIALPVLPAILPESIINRFTSIGDMKDSSTSYRVYIWMGTLAMIRDFWVSGIGMGSEAFTEIYPFYSYSGIVAPHSHNLFLQIIVESGVGGIAVFLLILIMFLKKMMTGWQYGGKGNSASVMITALSAGVCGFLLQGMFDNCFYNYRVLLVFWCVIGMAAACVKVLKKGDELND